MHPSDKIVIHNTCETYCRNSLKSSNRSLSALLDCDRNDLQWRVLCHGVSACDTFPVSMIVHCI